MQNHRYTRIPHLVALTALTVLLAACGSDGPSTSDIKARFEANLSGCDYVHLSDFSREGDEMKHWVQKGTDPNGSDVERDWTQDRVKVSYAIALDDIPEVKTAVANYIDLTSKAKALRADADAKQQIVSAGELAAGYHPDGSSAANDYLAAHPDQVAAAQAADQAAQQAADDASKLGAAPWQIAAGALHEVCPNLKSAGIVAKLFWTPQTDPATYGTAVSRQLTESILASKIDGGDWMY
ncbi:hypothetical protein [Burkholderia pseudomallei]|uniref:hypothetical protein n=1 Tax=Burkholderia pseudomallei TaxID=28450 RepID=UPI0005CB27C8|nr:hypothetical protein [Burkholderia pseudomallei]